VARRWGGGAGPGCPLEAYPPGARQCLDAWAREIQRRRSVQGPSTVHRVQLAAACSRRLDGGAGG
jgi:molybdopterin synthase catalytic subunit